MSKEASNLKSIIEKLDTNRPTIEKIDYGIMNQILDTTNFKNCHTTIAAMNLFYERLWASVVFPLQDDLHLYQRENGRLILEYDQERRKAIHAQKKSEKLQEQIDSVRKRIQEVGDFSVEETEYILFCEGSSLDQSDSRHSGSYTKGEDVPVGAEKIDMGTPLQNQTRN